MPKPFAELLADLRAEPNQPGVMDNVIDDLLESEGPTADQKAVLRSYKERLSRPVGRQNAVTLAVVQAFLESMLRTLIAERPGQGLRIGIPRGGRVLSQTKRFDRCVKAVRRTVKARKGSSKESAAIAICTKSILHPRGRTLKRYRKGRLLTQKRRS